MNKRQIIIAVLFLIASSAEAQMFVESIYSSIDQQTQQYDQKQDEVLRMDIFSPASDTLSQKPVLVYVHGGGFSGGRRDEERHLQFCRRFARKGYVAVTIDYTLHMKGKSFGCERPSNEKIQTFLKTGQDISRAVNHLIKQHQSLGIDTSRIVLAGSSAGAEAVLHAAYWNKTRADEDKQILPESFHYAGVISMAGAITNPNWITKDNAIPTMFFHGTCDRLVPYGTAPHHYCDATEPGFLMLFGPKPITKRLKKIGVSYVSVAGKNGGHEWNELPLFEYEQEITSFLYNAVIKNRIQQTILYENTAGIQSKAQTRCP